VNPLAHLTARRARLAAAAVVLALAVATAYPPGPTVAVQG
jgi:hypothetical protein